MAKSFTIDRLKNLVNHLKVAIELPKIAKHGTKGAVEATIVEELVKDMV
jgi:hypothetical protein